MTVLASKYSCLVQTPCAKTPEFGEAEFWVENARLCSELLWLPLRPGFAKKNSVSLCKGTKLQNSAKPNSWDCLPVFALECFSANETGVFFPEFSSAEFVGFGSRLLVRYGFLDAKAGFVGFGLGRLVRQSYLGAKAGLSLQSRFDKTPLYSQKALLLLFATGNLGASFILFLPGGFLPGCQIKLCPGKLLYQRL